MQQTIIYLTIVLDAVVACAGFSSLTRKRNVSPGRWQALFVAVASVVGIGILMAVNVKYAVFAQGVMPVMAVATLVFLVAILWFDGREVGRFLGRKG